LEEFGGFEELQHVRYSNLQILKFPAEYPVLKFLEINGKNLKELEIRRSSSNLTVARFCPNLQTLSIEISDEKLEEIFINRQQLKFGILIFLMKRNY